VVFDVYFANLNPKDPEADQRLAQALRAHGRVVLAAEHVASFQASVPSKRTLPPAPLFAEAAAAWGIAHVRKDPDYSVRQNYPGAPPHRSLAWKAAELANVKLDPDQSDPTPDRWLNYYGPPDAIPGVSYYLALRAENVPADFFRDKAVFVGARPLAGFAGEQKEEFRNPYTARTRRFSSGVEIHATAFLNLLRGDWLWRLPLWAEALALGVVGVLLGGGLARRRPLAAGLWALGAALAVTALALFLHWQCRVWWSWLTVLTVQIPTALGSSLAVDALRLYVEKRVLQHSLALHLPPARVRQVLRHPELRRPGGEEQTISILFSDIANFSTISSRMHPDDLFKLLNRYFDSSLGVIHRHHGTVVKLIGDGIFAIWNAPVPQPDHQRLACLAALELRQQMVRFDATTESFPLLTRLGLHTGRAYVGNVGSQTRFDYTAIGESVNLASRLEGLNRFLGTATLASRDLQRATEDVAVSRPVGHFRLKGLDEVVEVHELIGQKGEVNLSADLLARWRAGLRHFQRREFAAATDAFRQVLQWAPDDGPSRFYLDRLAAFAAEPPPQAWMGEIDLKEK
jgi:adenylate cyclase